MVFMLSLLLMLLFTVSVPMDGDVEDNIIESDGGNRCLCEHTAFLCF